MAERVATVGQVFGNAFWQSSEGGEIWDGLYWEEVGHSLDLGGSLDQAGSTWGAGKGGLKRG